MYDLNFSWTCGSKKRLRAIDPNEHQLSKRQIHEGLQNLSLSLEGRGTISKDSHLNLIPYRSCQNDVESDADALTSEMQYESQSQLECNSKDVDLKYGVVLDNGFDQPFTIPFHKGKYGRRVDFLVDELIRKSRRVAEQHCNNYNTSDSDFQIPSNVGPQPTTDLALTPSWPCSVSANALVPLDSSSILAFTPFPTISSKTSSIPRPGASSNLSSFADPRSCSYSSRSHTEWEILEVDTSNSTSSSTREKSRSMVYSSHGEDSDAMIVDGQPLEERQDHSLHPQDYDDSDDSDPGIIVP